MEITLWGVRGSRVLTGKDTIKYGGNTSCVEINTNNTSIIIDGGSGIVNAGKSLFKRKVKDVYVFLSHYHLDHINGLPFFKPFYSLNFNVNLYGSSYGNIEIREILNTIISPPYFPIGMESFSSNIIYNNISGGTDIYINDIKVSTIDNIHPDGGLYYKITYKGKTFSYITDIEIEEEIPSHLLEFIRGSNLLLFDATFTNKEYFGTQNKKGWGHSTWEKGVDIARIARVDKLLLFHHDTDKTDKDLDLIENKAREMFANTYLGKEGMKIKL